LDCFHAGVHRVYGTLKAFPQKIPEYVIADGRFIFTCPDNSNPAGVEKILEIFYRHNSSFMLFIFKQLIKITFLFPSFPDLIGLLGDSPEARESRKKKSIYFTL